MLSDPSPKGLGAKKNMGTPPVSEKNRGADWEMDLQNRGEERDSRKRPMLVVRIKSNGKYQFNIIGITSP
jgi:hypothetical protein